MTLTTEISEALPQFLVSTSNVHEEVQVVDVEYADKEKLDNVAVEEELGWDNLELIQKMMLIKFITSPVIMMIVRMMMRWTTKMTIIKFIALKRSCACE